MFHAAVSMIVLGSPAMTGKSKIYVSESYRHESKTTSGGDFSSHWTETQTAERTKLTIEVEIPVAAVHVDGATTFQVSVGNFSFKQTLGSDPKFAPGKTNAFLVDSISAPNSPVKTVISSAQVSWSKGRLFAKITADSPDAMSAAGSTFSDTQVGKIDVVLKASVKFGEEETNFSVPVSGRVARKVASSANVSGSATTVDLRGRTEIQ